MRIYYYMFTPDGNVVKEEIKARKNKDNYAIDAYTEYGGCEHRCISHLYIKNEDCIMGASSTSSNGCYMFSTTVNEITEGMREFSETRAEKIKKILEIEKELKERASKFKETTRRNNADL